MPGDRLIVWGNYVCFICFKAMERLTFRPCKCMHVYAVISLFERKMHYLKSHLMQNKVLGEARNSDQPLNTQQLCC